MKVVDEQIIALGADWGLLTYGLTTKNAETLVSRLALSLADLKACVHFCPDTEDTHGFLMKDSQGRHIPYADPFPLLSGYYLIVVVKSDLSPCFFARSAPCLPATSRRSG